MATRENELFNRYRNAAETRPRLKELRAKLLEIGGDEIVCPLDFDQLDDDLDNILDRGVIWKKWRVRMWEGVESQCHTNSILLWTVKPDDMRIATGFALSPDGLWRQHSWCVSKDKRRVYETTVRRTIYYGYVLTERESLMRFKSILPREMRHHFKSGWNMENLRQFRHALKVA
ncbi:MAG: hypothetical protein ICV60_02895 [Pyrinomonadaceae bacterium]|nr:hypothetical protein [Pyrinomonadaceae bacterium]